MRAIPPPREPPRNRLGRDGPAGDLTKKKKKTVYISNLLNFTLTCWLECARSGLTKMHALQHIRWLS